MRLQAVKHFVLILLSLFVFEAKSLTLTPADCTPGVCVTDAALGSPSNPDALDIAGFVGTTSTLSLLYKAEVGGTDSGLFADDYATRFANSGTDPEDAFISWLGGDFIDACGVECYLSVKDGNHDPSLYIFDLTGAWDGQELISLTDFWAPTIEDPQGKGAISNVAIWGTSTSVPEPGTLALFGLGLLGLALSRKKVS